MTKGSSTWRILFFLLLLLSLPFPFPFFFPMLLHPLTELVTVEVLGKMVYYIRIKRNYAAFIYQFIYFLFMYFLFAYSLICLLIYLFLYLDIYLLILLINHRGEDAFQNLTMILAESNLFESTTGFQIIIISNLSIIKQLSSPTCQAHHNQHQSNKCLRPRFFFLFFPFLPNSKYPLEWFKRQITQSRRLSLAVRINLPRLLTRE